MNKKSSFVFYETFRDQVECLPDSMKLDFYRAIINYGLDGTEPVFDQKLEGILKALWIGIAASIDSAKERRLEKISNGAKGGRPKKAVQSAQPVPPVPEEVPSVESVLSAQPEESPAETATVPLNDTVIQPVEEPSAQEEAFPQESGAVESLTPKEKAVESWLNSHDLSMDKETVSRIDGVLSQMGETGTEYLDYMLQQMQTTTIRGNSYSAMDANSKRRVFRAAVLEWTEMRAQYPKWLEERRQKEQAAQKAKSAPPRTCPVCRRDLIKGGSYPDGCCVVCGTYIKWSPQHGRWVTFKMSD